MSAESLPKLQEWKAPESDELSAGAGGDGVGLSSVDVPVEDTTGNGATRGGAEPMLPRVGVSASQAELSAPFTLSFLSPELQKGPDPRDSALGAASSLRPGQEAFLVTTLRHDPSYKASARRWIEKLRATGEEERGPSGGAIAVKVVWRVLAVVLRGLYGLFIRFIHDSQGVKKPTTPNLSGRQPARQAAPAKNVLRDSDPRIKNAEGKLSEEEHFEVAMRVVVTGTPGEEAELSQLRREMEDGFSAFRTDYQSIHFRECDGLEALLRFLPARADKRMLLSGAELGELTRIPDDQTHPQGLQVNRNKVKPLVPSRVVVLPTSGKLIENGRTDVSRIQFAVQGRDGKATGLIPLGLINQGTEDQQVVGMEANDLDKHAFFTGTTGTGKSEQMQWMVLGSIKDPARRSVIVFDPHGELLIDTVWNIASHAPERLSDVVIVDLSDTESPVAINPLDIQAHGQVGARVDQIMEMVKSQRNVSEQSAVRAVEVIQDVLYALCEANLSLPDHAKLTFLQLVQFLRDAEFRACVMQHVTNQQVLERFGPDGSYEQKKQGDQEQESAVAMRAFATFMRSETFANVFGASKNLLDFGQLIQDRRIILVSAGGLDENRSLGEFVCQLGIPMVMAASNAAGRKKTLTGDEESDAGVGVRVFIDEAAAVVKEADGTVGKILAQMRKRDLGLILTTQFPDQLPRGLVEESLANTQTKMVFKLSKKQVAPIADLVAPRREVTVEDIAELPNYYIYANVQQPGGRHTGTFAAATLPPPERTRTPERLALVERIQAQSHAILCNTREDMTSSRPTHAKKVQAELISAWRRREEQAELDRLRDEGREVRQISAEELLATMPERKTTGRQEVAPGEETAPEAAPRAGSVEVPQAESSEQAADRTEDFDSMWHEANGSPESSPGRRVSLIPTTEIPRRPSHEVAELAEARKAEREAMVERQRASRTPQLQGDDTSGNQPSGQPSPIEEPDGLAWLDDV